MNLFTFLAILGCVSAAAYLICNGHPVAGAWLIVLAFVLAP